MKKVNFIPTLSPEKQYAIRRWFIVTFFLIICSLMVSAYFMVPQLLTYIVLHKEVKALQIATQQHALHTKESDLLKTEHDTIHVRTKKIDSYHNAPKNPHQYIVAIMQACGESVTLETIKFNKKECDITLLCPTSEHATVLIQRLSSSDLFTHVKLVSLQQDLQTKQLRCVIKSKTV